MMLLLGMGLSIPASLLAGFAPSIGVLFVARLFGGVAAGMAFPTTLALITALWSGAARTKSIALWSALGGAIASLGPLLSGALLEHFDWGSVFFITLPLAALALFMAWRFVPAHVNETTEPVDNPGGILSILLIAALVLAINIAPVPGKGTLAIGLGVVALAAAGAFVIRQRRARSPLYDLDVAARRTFWVAACAGIIVFGSLMGAMFIGQQFLQNVLGYSTLDSGLAILPAAVLMVLVAPRSAKLVESRGARFTLLVGYVFCVLGFLGDAAALEGRHRLLEGRPRLRPDRDRRRLRRHPGLALADRLGAGHPRRDGLRHRRPPARPRRRDHAVDLRRPAHRRLRGGRQRGDRLLLRTGPGHRKRPGRADQVLLQRRRHRRPVPRTTAEQIIAAAKTSFLQGDQWAYTAGIVAILLGAALVFFCFPKKDEEKRLLEEYHDGGHRGRGRTGPGGELTPTRLCAAGLLVPRRDAKDGDHLGIVGLGVNDIGAGPAAEPAGGFVVADEDPGMVLPIPVLDPDRVALLEPMVGLAHGASIAAGSRSA